MEHNYVKQNIIVNFIIQKLKNKHTFLKKYKKPEKAKFSHFDRTRGDKNQIFLNIVSAFWMSFHPLLEGPNEQVTQKYMKGSRYVQLLLYFILISLKV